MTGKADQIVEAGSQRLRALSEKAAARGGLAAKAVILNRLLLRSARAAMAQGAMRGTHPHYFFEGMVARFCSSSRTACLSPGYQYSR